MFKTGAVIMLMAVLANTMPPASAEEPTLLYVLTNTAAGNTLTVLSYTSDRTFATLNTIDSGGVGVNRGLESQAPLTINASGTLAFGVNAGSNTLSAYRINGAQVELAGTIDTGGIEPVSVTVHENLVYVVNAGAGDEPGNVVGFSVNDAGALTLLSGATQPLSRADSAPAQIQFHPDGGSLVVTERLANRILVYPLSAGGTTVRKAARSPSHGRGPFGFTFHPRGYLLVSESAGGEKGTSAASSYRFKQNRVRAISGSVPTRQLAACWMVVTGSGRYAYVTNTPSNTISGFRLNSRGAMRMLNRDGVTVDTGASSRPTEMALSRDSRTLFVIHAGTRTVAAYAVGDDGSLTPAGSIQVPARPAGLIAR